MITREEFMGYSNKPAIVEITHTFDKASNVLTALDGRQGAKKTNRDFQYLYDELDRLAQSNRGVNGGSFTHAAYNANFTPSQKWGAGTGLDFLGNWKELVSDKDADGPDGNGTDNSETRAHNDANELTSLDPDGAGGGAAQTLTHDKAGNITSKHHSYTDSNNWTMYEYVHDGWNRLVKVTYKERISGSTGSPTTVAEYGYNGLTWRITKKADTSLPTINGLDEMRVMIYSAGWQMLEERVDTAWGGSGFTMDKMYQTIYGIRYIDDVVCRRLDANADGDFADGGDKTFYHLTDAQFSTVAVLDQNAKLLERIDYDPYGRARHHWRGDIDGDGDADSTDRAVITTYSGQRIYESNYDADADLDRNGIIRAGDADAWDGEGTLSALALGVLSASAVGNVFGFSGYIWNGEVAGSGGLGSDRGGIYTVRFRHYDVGLGRWLQRDPLEYVDGMSMYGYGPCSPLSGMDPYGLEWWNPFSAEYWHNMNEGLDALWDNKEDLMIGVAEGVVTGLLAAAAIAAAPLTAIPLGLLGLYLAYDTFVLRWAEMSEDEKVRAWGGLAGGAIGGWVGMKHMVPGVNAIRGLNGKVIRSWNWFRENMEPGSRMGTAEVSLDGTVVYRPGCFAAGTIVAAAACLMPIEQVQAGDQVWSYDQQKSEWALEEVVDTQEREYQGDMVTLRLQLSDKTFEEVVCTGDHPFWVVGGERLNERPVVADLPPEDQVTKPTGRWTEARWLRLGDRLLTKTGYSATVSGLTIRLERVKVYNLQVNRLQLYAIGRSGVLVHNSTPAGRPLHPAGVRKAQTRKIPGWVIDDTIENYPGVPAGNGKMVYYSPDNDITIVTGDYGAVISCRRGHPRPGQIPD